MCLRFVFLLITRAAAWLRLSQREEAWKTAEILILRHQLTVLQRRQPCRPRLNWADRALLAVLLAVIPKARRQVLRLLVRAENPIRGCEQRSCDVGDPAVMITNHVVRAENLVHGSDQQSCSPAVRP
jgi:hypothetical protein